MKKQCSSLWALAMLVLSLAVGAQNAPAGQGKTPEGIEAGGYSIQQSVELGYRYTDVAGTGANQEMFNTFLNLQTGPRVLEQTLSMRSLNHSGVLFDDLYVNSFGWGGDPNNAARVRVGKFKWYNFTGSFRRDQNYFDYPLLGNPMNNPLTSGIVAMPVNYSPHNFAVTRRMADVNLTLLPQSKVSVRLGYSRNRANGPSYNTNHEAGDAIMFQPWNTTFQTYNFGADFKLLPRTNISFDQFLEYGKNDTDTSLYPFANYAFQNPLAVGGFPSVELGLIPSNTCVPAAGGYAITTNCSGYQVYNRDQRIRTSTPTSQLSFQSNPTQKLQLTGRYSYSWLDLNEPAYTELFAGLVTRTAVRGWTTDAGVHSRAINGSGDFGVTYRVTDKLTLNDTFRVFNQRMPSDWNGTVSELVVNYTLSATGSITKPTFTDPVTKKQQTFNFTDCVDPITGALLLTPTNDPTRFVVAPNGQRVYYCHYEPGDGNGDVNTFFGQSSIGNTFEVGYDFTKHLGARVGYRFASNSINDFSYTDSDYQAWHYNENTALFGVWLRPVAGFHANGEVELTTNSWFTNRMMPRNQQHYRFRAGYTPNKHITVSGTANILENRNGYAEINYLGHNRNLGFSATYTLNDKFALDLSYNYGNYAQNAWMCFVDNPTAGFTLPSYGVCPTNGYQYSSPGFTWAQANPNAKYIYSNFAESNHYGSFLAMIHPINRVSLNLGYGITKADGNTQQLNQVLPLGPMAYTYHQPLASLSVEMAKSWTWNAYYNYDQYGESSFVGPTYPRYFHDNRATVSVRYAF